jgi:phosphoribosylformylglycinamidine cyclo-ligase
LTRESDKPLSYRDAGVDIDAAAAAKKKISGLVRSTFTENVLTELGGFGGLFRMPEGMRSPVLVSSADGVGTKLKIAFLTSRHNTVGIDLVNHCVNDILTTGARPLFFLDYIATGELEPDVVAEIVEGLSTACSDNGCALIGGETAEMPDFYSPGEYDLAGTIVGVVEEDSVLTGETVCPGDVLVGLPSSGLHTNGYSLARKVFFDVLGLGVEDEVRELRCSVGEELLRPHLSYGLMLREPIDNGWIKALAHITGGGITDNLPRSLPEGCDAAIRLDSWPVPPVFKLIKKAGRIEESEMLRVFNNGIGMIAVASAEDASRLGEHLGEGNWFPIGEIVASAKKRGEVKYVG